MADINELAIVRAFSVLESYVSDRGDTLVRRELPVTTSSSQLIQFAHKQMLGSLRGGFDRGPRKLWKEGLGVDFSGFGRNIHVNDLRELRNLIVHALGYIRPGGTELPKSIQARIVKLGARPESFVGRIPVADSEVDDALRLVRDFVLWADSSSPQQT